MAPQRKQSAQSSQSANQGKKPEYVCRARKYETNARTGQREATDFFQHIGVAWAQTFTNRKTGVVTEGFAVKLEAIPAQFDGGFVILPKREDAPEIETPE